MTNYEWIVAGRPHWQCLKYRGIFVTVPQADDFICYSCKNLHAPIEPKKAAEGDFTDWLDGGGSLLDHCVCLQYPGSCRFHNGGKTVTDGPHNVMPGLLGWSNPGVSYIGLPIDGRSNQVIVDGLSELEKARLYKALYDDGMRIDRSAQIIKEVK